MAAHSVILTFILFKQNDYLHIRTLFADLQFQISLKQQSVNTVNPLVKEDNEDDLDDFFDFLVQKLTPFVLLIILLLSIKVIDKQEKDKQRRTPKQICDHPIVNVQPTLLDKVDLSRGVEQIDAGNVNFVYKLFNSKNQPIAIFKPTYSAELDNRTLRFTSQQEVLNEVTAYKLNPDIIPETVKVSLPAEYFGGNYREMISGSLQKFISNAESCEDYGPSVFSSEDVQRIAIADMRILNLDRHPGNILMTQDKHLVPIDHSLAFPDAFYVQEGSLSNVTFDWLYYPQAKEDVPQQLLNFVDGIDLERDMELLRMSGLNMGQMLSVYMSTKLLKVGLLQHGMTIYAVGLLMQRQGKRDCFSDFELLLANVVDRSSVETSWKEMTRFADDAIQKYFA